MKQSKTLTILMTGMALAGMLAVQGIVSYSEAAAPKASKGNPAKGKKVFEMTCASCHGMKGLGDGPAGMALNPKPRNFAHDKFKFGTTVAALTHTVETGSAGTAMVGWKGTLKPDQIADVVAYIRTFIPKANLDKAAGK